MPSMSKNTAPGNVRGHVFGFCVALQRRQIERTVDDGDIRLAEFDRPASRSNGASGCESGQDMRSFVCSVNAGLA